MWRASILWSAMAMACLCLVFLSAGEVGAQVTLPNSVCGFRICSSSPAPCANGTCEPAMSGYPCKDEDYHIDGSNEPSCELSNMTCNNTSTLVQCFRALACICLPGEGAEYVCFATGTEVQPWEAGLGCDFVLP
jgi:hypothetical protein